MEGVVTGRAHGTSVVEQLLSELMGSEEKTRLRSKHELDEQFNGLVKISKALNSLGVKWFVTGGTLLGIVRDGDFIQWDWDVEISLLTEEARPRRAELLEVFSSFGLHVARFNFSRRDFKIVISGYGTEYEILGQYLRKGKFRARRMAQVSRRYFDGYELIEFRGRKFPAPVERRSYLAELYGDWTTPKRTSVHAEYLSNEAYLTPKTWSYRTRRLARRVAETVKYFLTG